MEASAVSWTVLYSSSEYDLVKDVCSSVSPSTLLHSVCTFCEHRMISRFESSVWKAKPRF